MISQKQILIVEDNEINRMMLGEILSADYQVIEAENGLEALSVLKERGDVISLILLDITMPVMDGYTFLSIVKKDPCLFFHSGYRYHPERQRIGRGGSPFPRCIGFCCQTLQAPNHTSQSGKHHQSA